MDTEKNILCYGDSNTWGTIPRWEESAIPSERYDKDTRWTAVLAADLGAGYHVIEEGLGGRTTVYAPPQAPWKCGADYLVPCLFSHRPLDLVILMLGTNDLQKVHQPPLEKLGDGITRLIELIQTHPNCGRNQQPPQILVVAPTFIKPSAPNGRILVYPKFNGETGRALSLAFPEVYGRVAREKGCLFLDAAQFAEPSDGDGVHLTAESHIRLGHGIAALLKENFFRKEG